MRKLRVDDIVDHRAYERERDEFRAEIIAMKRQRLITIPHVAWIPYIGWDETMVQIGQPVGEPGYRAVEDPFASNEY